MNDEPTTSVRCPNCCPDLRSEPLPGCFVCFGSGRVSPSIAMKYRNDKTSFRRAVSTRTVLGGVTCPCCVSCELCDGAREVPLSKATAWCLAQGRDKKDTIPSPPPDECK
jgi:hypothetical protein